MYIIWFVFIYYLVSPYLVLFAFLRSLNHIDLWSCKDCSTMFEQTSWSKICVQQPTCDGNVAPLRSEWEIWEPDSLTHISCKSLSSRASAWHRLEWHIVFYNTFSCLGYILAKGMVIECQPRSNQETVGRTSGHAMHTAVLFDPRSPSLLFRWNFLEPLRPAVDEVIHLIVVRRFLLRSYYANKNEHKQTQTNKKEYFGYFWFKVAMYVEATALGKA